MASCFSLPPVDIPLGQVSRSWIYRTPPDVEGVLQEVLAGTFEDVQQSLSKCDLTSDLRRFFPVVSAAAQRNQTRTLLHLFSVGVPTTCLGVWDAIQSRSSDVFQILLDNKWNINAPLGQQEPPALAYVKTTGRFVHDLLTNNRHVVDNEHLTQWFLDHDANPNAACDLDKTPLSYAVYKASRAIIELLFQCGGDIEQGQLLHHAVKRPGADAVDIVQYLLNRGARINEIKYSNHEYSYRVRYRLGLGTALHKAVELGRSDLVSLLLEHGADPMIKDTKGVTSTEQAEISDYNDIKRTLLESGCNA